MTRLLAALVLLAACRPAAAQIVWDRVHKHKGGSDLTPGTGGSVHHGYGFQDQYLRERGGRIHVVYAHGSWRWDIDAGTVDTHSDWPALPLASLKHGDKSAFELSSPTQPAPYKGRYSTMQGSAFVAGGQRYVFLDGSGRLTVVDMNTLKAKALMNADSFTLHSDRVLIGRSGGSFRAFDALIPEECPGYTQTHRYITCDLPQFTGALGLDAWYRPIRREAAAIVDGRELRLVDRAGATRYEDKTSAKLSKRRIFSSDGRRFAYPDAKGRIVVVDLETFKVLRAFPTGEYEQEYSEFSPTGRYLRNSFGLFDIDAGSTRSLRGPLYANNSPDDAYALETGGYPDYVLSLKGLTDGTAVPLMKGDANFARFSPLGGFVLVGKEDSANMPGRVFAVPSGRLVAAIDGAWKYARFSPDDRMLVLISAGEERLRFVDLRLMAQTSLALPKGEGRIYGLGFSGDGRWLVASGGDSFRAWRLRPELMRRDMIEGFQAESASAAAALAAARESALAKSASEYAAKISTAKPVKGEFESSAEFAERVKAAEEQVAALSRESTGEAKRIAGEWDLKAASDAARRKEQLESGLDEEFTLVSPAKPVRYEADAQEFVVSYEALGQSNLARVPVARRDAPGVKERMLEAALVINHTLVDGKPRPRELRLSIKDPVLGELYSWSTGGETVRRAKASPDAPPRLELRVAFADGDGDGALSSGEAARVTATLSNTGAGPARAASIVMEPAAIEGLGFASRHFVGEVPAGSSRAVTIPLKALFGVADGERSLTLSARDANGFSTDPFKLVFQTRARRGARLSLAEFKVKEAGGDGVVTPGELVELVLRVRNDGAGAAEAAAVALTGANADLFIQGESRRILGALAPGQTAEVRYTVFSNTSLAGERMRYDAALSEAGGSWSAPIDIPLRRALGATRELVVKAQASASAAPAAASDADKPVSTGAPNPDAYAVILGAEDYAKAARVSHARRDAASFKEFATRILGVPDDAAHLFYLDEGVTLAELRKAFTPNGWLARRVGPGSDVYVFYAGHGAPSLDGKGAYLVPQDGDPNYAVETGFPVDELMSTLAGLKAKTATVWLDACFSGADRESRSLLADARPLLHKTDLRVPEGKVALFGAATGSQVSSAYPEKRHGLFTWFSLRGLDGEADADKDGRLTAGELADYLSARVPRAAGALDREQTPVFRGDRERVLARYRR